MSEAAASNGQVDPIGMCRPRPTPVTWSMDIIRGSFPGGEPQVYGQLKMLSWNGEFYTYWPEATLSKFSKDVRALLRMMSEARTGLATPDDSGRSDSGIILPPGA